MLFKTGVVTYGIHHRIRRAIPVIDDVWNEVTGHDALCTSMNDGTHAEWSLHWEGKALDLRTRHTNFTNGRRWPVLTVDQEERIINKLINRLGEDFDVVLEPDHIHIEYDPE